MPRNARRWSGERQAQHDALFRDAEKAERNRLAQARFRERHAKHRADVRKVTNLLLRRDGLDPSGLAKALVECLGPSSAKALRKELLARTKAKKK